jgi:hypothetical protein
LFVVLPIALGLHSARAEVSVSVRLNPQKVAAGEGAILELELSGARQASLPILPEIAGLAFSGWQHSTQTSIVNGRYSQSVKFTCQVHAKQAGTYTIKGIRLQADGKVYQVTHEVSLQVVEGYAAKEVVVLLTLNKQEAYLSEPVLLTFDWLFNKEIQGFDIRLPWFPPKGFLVFDPVNRDGAANPSGERREEKELPINQQANSQPVIFSIDRTTHDGQEYVRYRFQRLLTPLAVGEHTFGPSEVAARVLLGYKKGGRDSRFNDPFFDSFFDRREPVTKDLVSSANPVKLLVRDLPEEGRPDKFAGNVGSFDLEASVSPVKVKVGDPITLQMVVSGTGNIESLTAPELTDTTGFRLYDAESKANVEPVGTTFRGQKTFSVPLVPTDDSVKHVPALRFSFFDPAQKAYRTLTKGPFPVTVTPGDKDDGVGLISAPEPGQRKLTVKPVAGIFPLRRPSLAQFRNYSAPFYDKPLWLALMPFPALLCVLCFFLERHWSRIGGDVALQRSLKASSAASQRLKAARSLQGTEFYQAVSEALTGFVADKCNLPPASVDARSAPELLTQQEVTQDDVSALVSLLEQCDLGRFGGDASAADREGLLSRAKDLLASLGRSLR